VTVEGAALAKDGSDSAGSMGWVCIGTSVDAQAPQTQPPATALADLATRWPDGRTLSYEATIDDPGAYTKPWTVRWTISATSKSSWMPGGEIFEYICQAD